MDEPTEETTTEREELSPQLKARLEAIADEIRALSYKHPVYSAGWGDLRVAEDRVRSLLPSPLEKLAQALARPRTEDEKLEETLRGLVDEGRPAIPTDGGTAR